MGKYYCEVNDFEKSKQYLKNCLKIRRNFFEKVFKNKKIFLGFLNHFK